MSAAWAEAAKLARPSARTSVFFIFRSPRSKHPRTDAESVCFSLYAVGHSAAGTRDESAIGQQLGLKSLFRPFCHVRDAISGTFASLTVSGPTQLPSKSNRRFRRVTDSPAMGSLNWGESRGSDFSATAHVRLQRKQLLAGRALRRALDFPVAGNQR